MAFRFSLWISCACPSLLRHPFGVPFIFTDWWDVAPPFVVSSMALWRASILTLWLIFFFFLRLCTYPSPFGRLYFSAKHPFLPPFFPGNFFFFHVIHGPFSFSYEFSPTIFSQPIHPPPFLFTQQYRIFFAFPLVVFLLWGSVCGVLINISTMDVDPLSWNPPSRSPGPSAFIRILLQTIKHRSRPLTVAFIFLRDGKHPLLLLQLFTLCFFFAHSLSWWLIFSVLSPLFLSKNTESLCSPKAVTLGF